MERKIGEIFDYEGIKLKVIEDVKTTSCVNAHCHFSYATVKCETFEKQIGSCQKKKRSDNINIHFEKVEL